MAAPAPYDAGVSKIRERAWRVCVKVVSAGAFAVLAAVQEDLVATQLGDTLRRPSLQTVTFLASRVLTLALPAVVALLYVLRREEPEARGGRLTAVVSVYASFVLLAVRPLELLFDVPVGSPDFGTAIAANVLTAVGAAIALVGLGSLRGSFSIAPQARRLRTSGAYRFVRHPVYTGEIATAVGLGLVLPSVFTWVLLASFVAAQVFRARQEEKLLAGVFAGYDAYRRRTGMLFPRVLQAEGQTRDLVLHSGRREPAHSGD
jgi:protein-S-isoprenylcysteine O-methyltransferase Ste14